MGSKPTSKGLEHQEGVAELAGLQAGGGHGAHHVGESGQYCGH